MSRRAHRLWRRLVAQDGIGVVELVFAIAILNVAILALFTAFSASTFSLVRASRISNATVVAEQQMELYRAMLYTDIGLSSTLLASVDATHTSHAEWVSLGSQTTASSCTTALPQCKPQQTAVTGPDGTSYRVDTYVRAVALPGGRTVKRVAVIVYSGTTQRARLVSNFDQSTGCIVGSVMNPC